MAALGVSGRRHENGACRTSWWLSDEWMVEWMDEWMDEWMGGWVNWWMSEWVSEWVDEWVDEWIDEWVNGWVNDWMSEWMSEWWFNVWINGWVNGLVMNWWVNDEWMDEWVSRWKREQKMQKFAIMTDLRLIYTGRPFAMPYHHWLPPGHPHPLASRQGGVNNGAVVMPGCNKRWRTSEGTMANPLYALLFFL